ncbi:Major facilitator superfamily (MFS) profile [Nakaseomyces glabratus]|nr:Major facilitator superfamily (MFS) profile [Nakaseomyces glabratus]KAH7600255.1 Major facilitator superfamily (MFS) profile [Nakaseomyces glabratus]
MSTSSNTSGECSPFSITDSIVVQATDDNADKILQEVDLSDPNIDKNDTFELRQQVSIKESPLYYLRDIPYSAYISFQVSLIFLIVIYNGFLGPLAGNVFIPALPLLQKEFNVSETTINATVSVFMATFSISPLFWGALADKGGRKILYIISISLMVIINILLASVPKKIGSLIFLRIIQAFASSSVISLGAGTVADLTPPKDRGKAMAYFMLGPNLGPILAPIIAGLILLDNNNWRWLFGFLCIVSGLGLIMVILLLPETLRCIVGNGDRQWENWSQNENDMSTQPVDFSSPISRWSFVSDIGFLNPITQDSIFKGLYPHPPKFSVWTYLRIMTFPPVILTSIANALLFCTYYSISVTLSHFLATEYSYSNLKIGACYVCPGVCMLLGSQIGGHLSDSMRKSWKKENYNTEYPLEFRLILTVCGVLLAIGGSIGYGWCIQFHYHISAVLVFAGLMAFGLTWCNNTIMTYLSELLSLRVSSAIAVSSFFRNIAAAISSALIAKLCQKMGIGFCFLGLGLINLVSLFSILVLINNRNKWVKDSF